MTQQSISQRLQFKAIKVRAWLLLSSILTGVCGVLLPVFIAYLYAVRPHVTHASQGFILPHYKNGISYYFAHSDETMIRILSFGLMLGMIALILSSIYALRRPLMRKLQPPEDPPVPENTPVDVITDDSDSSPS